MRRSAWGIFAVVGLAACAGVPPPRAEEASAVLAVRGAREAGAARDERGLLQLELAEEQLENGRALMRDGDHRAARVVLRRAKAEAEAAKSLAPAKLTASKVEVVEVNKAEPVAVPRPAVGGGPRDPSERAEQKPEPPIVEEKPAPAEAEKTAREALDKIAIAGIGAVRVDPRGTVICIPASTLFHDDAAELSPEATEKLYVVVQALRGAGEHEIAVEGYTDSHGDAASQRALSQRRAEAVRAFLAARGAPADRLRASGLGAARPIADNDTVRGRARNHRIEIVIRPVEEK
jgi:outer membrane protein OmpA-like peptidoglycan-associated protein